MFVCLFVCWVVVVVVVLVSRLGISERRVFFGGLVRFVERFFQVREE